MGIDYDSKFIIGWEIIDTEKAIHNLREHHMKGSCISDKSECLKCDVECLWFFHEPGLLGKWDILYSLPTYDCDFDVMRFFLTFKISNNNDPVSFIELKNLVDDDEIKKGKEIAKKLGIQNIGDPMLESIPFTH